MRPLFFKSQGFSGYRTTFSRHIHSVLINGFMARELDADDHEFLEYVKTRGIANGSLPNTGVASIEELDFWQLPYDVARGVERRVGPVPLRERPVDTPEQRALRLAKLNAWHARRVIREQERAIAAVELERERVAWALAKEKRRAQDALSDAEWEAAAPRKESRGSKGTPPWPRGWGPDPRKQVAKFGATIDRHYVPQWKLDEEMDAAIAKAETKKAAAREAKEARIAAKRQAEAALAAQREAAADAEAKRREAGARQVARAAERGEAERWREAGARQAALAARQRAAAEAERATAAERARVARPVDVEWEQYRYIRDAEIQAEIRARDETDRLRREAIIEDARRTVDQTTRLINETRAAQPASYTAESLKQAIMTLGNSMPGKVWMEEEMERALGCPRWLLDYCLNELVREAKLRIT